MAHGAGYDRGERLQRGENLGARGLATGGSGAARDAAIEPVDAVADDPAEMTQHGLRSAHVRGRTGT